MKPNCDQSPLNTASHRSKLRVPEITETTESLENPETMFSAPQITRLHDDECRLWHENPAAWTEESDGFLQLVRVQHKANFDLWHIEDQARIPAVADTQLARAKRKIDVTNQRRNDLTEELDRALLEWLKPLALPSTDAPLHSETPGLIIDRLSILSLKMYHTNEEIDRQNAPPDHAERNRARLLILTEQRTDLAQCLDALWTDIRAQKRRFKLYRQLKMYNDPSLNPAIYRLQDTH